MKNTILKLATAIILIFPLTQVFADDFIPETEETAVETFILDADNTGGDITLQFGKLLNEQIKWDAANTRFNISNNLNIEGNITATQLGLNTNTPHSTLHNAGSVARKITTVTNNYTATNTDNTIFINANTNDITISLPSATGITGREYIFKAINTTNDIFIKSPTGETIDGTNQHLLTNTNDLIGIISDGNNWYISYFKNGEEFSAINTGNGSNGDITINAASTIINEYAYITGNTASASTTITVNDASNFSTGDEIFIHQTQDDTNSNEGKNEFSTIQSIAGNTITLSTGTSNTYYSGTFNALAAEVTQIINVPNYNNITIQNGASITAQNWNGYTGGLVAFRANGTTNFETGNNGINTSGTGFRGGGDNGGGNNDPGDPGEGFAGLGWQNDSTTNNTNANENGGGGGYGPSGYGGTAGGGGGNKTQGGNAVESGGAPPAIAQGGDAVGSENLSTIFLGGGGGGGGDNDGATPAAIGGNGGGIVMIFAKKIINLNINSSGTNGANGGAASAGDGGGGAGGVAWISAFSLTVDNANINGGIGGTDGDDIAGDGGNGWYVITGTTSSTSTSSNALYFGIDSAGGTDCNGPCQVPWGTDSRIDSTYFTHDTSTNASQIIVDESGWYKINYTVTFNNNDGNNDRVTMRCRVQKNGSTFQDGSAGRTYLRDYAYGEYSSITNTSLIELDSNNYIEIVCDKTSGSTGGTTTIANETSILIEKM